MWNGLDGPIPSVWDLEGFRRGGAGDSNLDMNMEELKELSELALHRSFRPAGYETRGMGCAPMLPFLGRRH
jgi:hypothetical protein